LARGLLRLVSGGGAAYDDELESDDDDADESDEDAEAVEDESLDDEDDALEAVVSWAGVVS